MPAVRLGTKAYSRIAGSVPETRLVNLYMEADESGSSPDQYFRLQRPGLTRISTSSQPIRGIYQSDNSITSDPICVAGTEWFHLANGGDTVVIGSIIDDGLPVRIAATFERVGVVSAGDFYIWNGSTTMLVQVRDKLAANDPGIELSPLPPIIDIDVLNGYFVLATSTGTFYWLVPGEATVQALNYASAEALPDGLVAVRRLRDELFLIGQQSIEVWQPSGNADAAFTPATGRLIDRGCVSRDSVALFDNTLVWCGDDSIVYRMAAVPERISDFGIEERLRNRTDDPSAWVFTSYGHKFYCLTVPGQGTFAYDAASQMWSEFASLNATTWRAAIGTDTADGAIAGDATGLFKLDPTSSLDDGVPFLRLTTGTIALPARPAANSSLAIGIGSSQSAIFSLRWNDPRRGWSQPIELLARGEGDILDCWRLGVARAPSRTFEISTVSPAIIRISGAVANEAWRV